MVYPYDEILFVNKREQPVAIYHNTDESEKHYGKLKSHRQETTYFMIALHEISKKGKCLETESRLVAVWGWELRMGIDCLRTCRIFWGVVTEMF